MLGKTGRSLFRRLLLVALLPMLVINALWLALSQSGHSLIEAGVLTLIGGVVVTAGAAAVSKRFSTPLKTLRDGAMKIGSGFLDYKIPLRGNGELGELAKTLNDMGDSLNAMMAHTRFENQALAAESSKLAAVLNSISDGVVAIDHQQNIVLANQAAANLVGSLPQVLAGANVNQAFRWTDGINELSLNSNTTGVNYHADIRLPNPQGQFTWIDVVTAKIADDPSGIDLIITIQDKTKSHELETMKLDFVSMAAHELRTPLTAIRGYLSLVQETSNLPAADQEYLERAAISANRLAALINNMLNVSKIERGGLNLAVERIDWAAIASGLIEDYKVRARDRQINLNYDGPTTGLFTRGDELALTEVLGNLLSNAVQYTETSGNIIVTVALDHDHIVTRVTDTGRGIPASALPQLFTKFYRAGGPKESGTKGTGLGLYISKTIIEQHGGKIWVDSREGLGSTFTFTLPVYTGPATGDTNTIRTKHGWIAKSPTR